MKKINFSFIVSAIVLLCILPEHLRIKPNKKNSWRGRNGFNQSWTGCIVQSGIIVPQLIEDFWILNLYNMDDGSVDFL